MCDPEKNKSVENSEVFEHEIIEAEATDDDEAENANTQTVTLGEVTGNTVHIIDSVNHDDQHEVMEDELSAVPNVSFAQDIINSHHNHTDEDTDDSVSSGTESDPDDLHIEEMYPSLRSPDREEPIDFPETVTLLTTPEGARVYIVGTAHFSKESQNDVAKMIQQCQPDRVMLELCQNRVGMLQIDEETLMKEAKQINLQTLRTAVKQNGVVQGVMNILMLNMSAKLTKELGMAPGGEFRVAFHEAQHIPGCRLHLGDRPIGVTLKRAIGSLTVWQKLRLGWHMMTTNDTITKEEVEKCKQRDLLEQLMTELTGEFPAISRVFVTERDQFLAESLRHAAEPISAPHTELGYVAPVVVGVVGMGHVKGIVENWDSHCDLKTLMELPPRSTVGRVTSWSMKATIVGLISWGCFKVFRWTIKQLNPGWISKEE